MYHISSSSSSEILQEEVVFFCSLDSTDSSEIKSSRPSTDTSIMSELDREQYDLFIEEYFHQQHLIMQNLYPPSFKSKQNKHKKLDDLTQIKQLSSSNTDAIDQRPIAAYLVTCFGQQQQNNENSPPENFTAKKKRTFPSMQKLLRRLESWGRALFYGRAN